MEHAQKRSFYWDNIKGFLMLLTVFAHILLPFQNNEIINSTFDYIYMFHMPVFIFLSGFFGKSERCRSLGAIVRLAFLYYVFNSIMWFLFGGTSLLIPLYSYWYLIALIVWRLTAHHLAKFKNITLILSIIAFLIGFFPSVDNTLAASRIISFYPFYISGYLLSSEKGNHLAEIKYSSRVAKGLLWLALAVIAAIASRTIFSYTDDSLLMFGYVEPFDAFGRLAIFGTAVLALLAIRHLTPSKKVPLLSIMGRNSLWIFLIHRPLTLLISNLLEDSNCQTVIAVAAAATIAICIIFGNDYTAAPLNRFAQQGEEIFTLHKKNFTPAKLVAAVIAAAFAVSAVAGVYS